jgi:hypothetical protein
MAASQQAMLMGGDDSLDAGTVACPLPFPRWNSVRSVDVDRAIRDPLGVDPDFA